MTGVMFSFIVAAGSNLVQWRKDGIIAEHNGYTTSVLVLVEMLVEG